MKKIILILLVGIFVPNISAQIKTDTITNEKIIKLTKIGLEQSIIINKIQNSFAYFDLSPNGIAILNNNMVAPDVISEMKKVNNYAPIVSLGNLQPKAEILTNNKIILLTKIGLEPAIIINKISLCQNKFNITTDSLINLGQNGVASEVMNEMIKVSLADKKVLQETPVTQIMGGGDFVNMESNIKYQDVVYLKKGSVVRGTVLEQIPDKSIKIQTIDGNTTIYQMNEIDKLSKEIMSEFNQGNTNSNVESRYHRSSLYTLMVVDPVMPYADSIENAFIKSNTLDKFDDHNLFIREIPFQSGKKIKTQQANIDNYLKSNNIAKKLVEKWFNRTEKGAFNMNLVAKRGFYNASDIDVNIAKLTQRGTSMLADAGEELIKNTFVLVSHIKYYDKAEDAEKAKKAIGIIAGIASAAGVSGANTIGTVATVGATVLGKGYRVRTTAYLYRLRWNDEIANTFYNKYWTDEASFDVNKAREFDLSNLFILDFVGTDQAYNDVQSTIFTNKSDAELVGRSTRRTVDNVVAKLQKNHEEFRTKTPLLTVDPITAKIGLKEGLEPGDKYDVLEKTIDGSGKTYYKQIGVVKVDEKQIWDNMYSLAEESVNNNLDRTLFIKVSGGDFQPGMLLKQSDEIKSK